MLGTTQKVLHNLQKLSSDKKSQLTARHDEHSVWLATELAKIKNLLKKPEDEAVQSSSKATTAQRTSDESTRGKRKSPDVSEQPNIRQSPDQKRSSTDYTQLALDAGLPADLNKLKKEQLLNEIESRGDTSFTIKSLKKELVDALKDMLAMEAMKMSEAEPAGAGAEEGVPAEEAHEQDIEPDANGQSSEMCVSPAPKASAAAATSLSAEPAPATAEEEAARTAAANAIAATAAAAMLASAPVPTAPHDPQAALQERMARHRLSQARKSTLPVEEDEETDEAQGQGQGQAAQGEPVAESTPEDAAFTAEGASAPIVAEEAPVEENHSAWQDVHSPMAADTSPAPAPASASAIAASMNAAAASASASATAMGSGGVKTASGGSGKTVLASFSVSKAAAGTGKPANPPASGMLKKPSNLAGSAQSSFLDKGKPAAQPIAALAQAAKLREAEELKALQKKQAQLQAQQAHQQGHSGAGGNITSASIIMKANMTLNSTTASGVAKQPLGASAMGSAKARLPPQMVPSAPAPAPKPAAAPAPAPTPAENAAPVSNGSSIMGFLNPFGKATATTPTRTDSAPAPAAATALPAKPTTPAPAPAAAPSPVKQPLQVHQPVQQQPAPVAVEEEEEEEEQQYEMDDMADSDEDDSGTDEEKEEKFIPEWARSVNLKSALARQFGLVPGIPPMDPDTIFPEVATCSLEEIFGKMEGKFGKYARRTSSAKWEHDELTLVEKRKYRNVMGYSVDQL